MSNDELLKYQQSINSITYIFGGVLLFLFCLNIYSIFQKGFTVLRVLPIAFIPIALLSILIINFGTLSKIKKEMAGRDTK